MDPQSYQQMMIQQLMQQGSTPSEMHGQNASSPYGQSFVTGNQMQAGAGMGQNGYPSQQASSMPGMLGQPAPSTVLQQPMATYGSA